MATGNNIKPKLELVDESFYQKPYVQLCLSIQISSDSICFSVIDWSNSKQLLLKDYRYEDQVKDTSQLNLLEVIFEQNSYLSNPFKKVSVSIVNNTYTFVPSPLFEASSAKEYLQINCKFSEKEEVIYTSMKNMNAYCVFAIDKKLKSFFNYQFSEVKYLHHSMVLCDALLNNFKNIEQQSVIINIRYNDFDTVIIKNKKVELINTFSYTNADDLLFYLLYVFEQLSINPDKQEVLVCGDLQKNSLIYEKLVKYIRYVNFMNRNSSVEYSYKFNEVPHHFYYTLLNQYQEF